MTKPMAGPSSLPPPGTDPRPRIVIADKNPVVRAGIQGFIARDGRFEVAGVFPNGIAFLDFAEKHVVDLALIGWALPDMRGSDILAALKRRHSPIRVVVYTGEPGRDVLRQAVLLGAWGYLLPWS